MKKLTLLLFAMLTICSASAQETVKLTVSGQGATKEEATANALRSAIEQSFGVFVSANTQILNDEVVKDEIATISSGNIQEYKELGCITMPNGQQSVTLSAVVSIENLISYAKNKGSSAEFAGQLFAMNIKMHKLNAENEKKAIEHMLEQLKILAKGMFRIEINIKDQPKIFQVDDGDKLLLYTGRCDYDAKNYIKRYISPQPYAINLEFKYYTTPQCKAFYDLLFNTLESLSLSKNDIELYEEVGISKYHFFYKDEFFNKIRYEKVCDDGVTRTIEYSNPEYPFLFSSYFKPFEIDDRTWVAKGKAPIISQIYSNEKNILDSCIIRTTKEFSEAETIRNSKKREKALSIINRKLIKAKARFADCQRSCEAYAYNSMSKWDFGSGSSEFYEVNFYHDYVLRTDPRIIFATLQDIFLSAQAEAYNLYLEGCNLRIQAKDSLRLHIKDENTICYKCPSLHLLAFEAPLLFYTSNAFLLLSEEEIANLKKIEIIF